MPMDSVPSLSPTLTPLSSLASIADGRDAYYRHLASSDDEILRVGAWCVLLETGAVTGADHAAVLQLAHHGAVRRRAYAHYARIRERDLALEVAQVDRADQVDWEQQSMIAAQRADASLTHAVHLAGFLADGSLKHLSSAAEAMNDASGWRSAAIWYARVVALNPTDFDSAASLAYLLDQANQRELLGDCLALLAQVPRLQPVVELFGASAKLAAGDAAGCLSSLDALEARSQRSDTKFVVGALGIRLRARALHDLGRYQEAYRSYSAMNQADAPAFPKAASYVSRVTANNQRVIPSLPGAGRSNYVMMLGFPRSGTTLLENALAAHPQVETFEEVGSLDLANGYIERAQAGKAALPHESTALFEEARRRYFADIDRLSRKPEASVFVDKMPIRSLEAPFLKGLLPDQRYIFSIRHPYDVALSCFQQRFKPNSAMASFLSMGDTIQLYDLTMSTWFKVHALEDPLVHYVRYNQLVVAFEEKVAGTLAFLGLDWDPAVLDFAQRADSRASKTPSYQKVRQGLGIGVQTHWKEYDFLFKQKEAAPLTKWAKFFGYETV